MKMNKKYIDADEFVKEINDCIDAAFKWGESATAYEDEEIKTRVEQAVATFCEAILTAMKMPTADVAEVVRCYQCKYHTTDDECTHPHWDKDELIICPKALDMDYCSYGEKKDG